MTICCSCRKQFKQTSKTSDNFCQKCNRKINMKLEWRGCLRRLTTNLDLGIRARARTKKKMVKINDKLIKEFGIDMTKDKISNPGENIKH